MTQDATTAIGPGTLIGNNVRLKRLLGQGGMGSVWVAEHEGLQTEVAVKFISAEIVEKPEAVARFKREATAAAQLRSPHVVQVFDHGVTPQGDVGKRVGRFGRLPVLEVNTIVTQACKALGKAHARGIVHRDIKPDNIYLVDSEGEIFVKLLDFGIAKRAEDSALNMTNTGTMVGTPYFMSPEQVMSAKDADFRSDLWSLAVVAYNALSGRVPFFAETLGALCIAIHSGKHEPVTLGRPELPKALDAWFQRALARDPAARFASAKEMAVEFARAADLAIAPTASMSGSKAAPLAAGLTAAINTPGFGTTPSPMPTPAAPNTLLGATVTHAGTAKSHKLVAFISLVGVMVVLVVALGAFLMRARAGPGAAAGSSIASAPVSGETAPPPRAEAAPPTTAPTASPAITVSTVQPASSARSERQAVTEPVRRKSASTQPAKAKPPAKATASAAASTKQAPATSKKGKDYGF
jgi:serine/threonine-protein kinase